MVILLVPPSPMAQRPERSGTFDSNLGPLRVNVATPR
jgi:hypothetical protein